MFAQISVAQDTASINFIDANNLKQGHWVYRNDVKKLPDYGPNQKIEEGDYADNLKEGKWLKYYNNDKIKHELTYQNDRPNGHAIFYYRNGKKSEEGIWKNNKWVGEYKYYYESGTLAYDWNYNASGKREGEQKYYHENGQLMIEGSWDNGKEAGTVKEYFSNGEIKSEKVYNDGVMDASKVKNYKKSPDPVVEAPKQEETAKESTEIVKKEKKSTVFDANGYQEIKDRNGRIVRKGTFQEGFLLDGEVYQYNSTGKKIRTTVYKGGRVREIINH